MTSLIAFPLASAMFCAATLAAQTTPLNVKTRRMGIDDDERNQRPAADLRRKCSTK